MGRQTNWFHGGANLSNTATSAIWVVNEVSISADEDIVMKVHFEEWLHDWASTKMHILNDVVFTADIFSKDAGFGAHDQNDHAEHTIQAIIFMVRTNMLHISRHWSEHSFDGLASSTKFYHRSTSNWKAQHDMFDHDDLPRTLVWGCFTLCLTPSFKIARKSSIEFSMLGFVCFLGYQWEFIFGDQHQKLYDWTC